MPADTADNLAVLTRRLHELALDYDVEARGGVAILTPRGQGAANLEVSARRLLVQLARDAGFANVALEV